jgi:hypothetical protein
MQDGRERQEGREGAHQRPIEHDVNAEAAERA